MRPSGVIMNGQRPNRVWKTMNVTALSMKLSSSAPAMPTMPYAGTITNNNNNNNGYF